MKKIIIATFSTLLLVCLIVLSQGLNANQTKSEKREWASPLKPIISHEGSHLTIPKEFCHFGLSLLNVKIDTLTIKRNQTFSVIASKKGVSDQDIFELIKNSREVFNIRKLRKGKKILFISNSEQNHETKNSMRTLVYLPSSYEYVAFNISNHHVWKGKTPIISTIKEAYGVINHSLFMSLNDSELTNNVVDIFAWQIDFQRLLKGDEYKIIYEEISSNGKNIGIGKIFSAWIKHADNDIYAFSYNQNGKLGYYDSKGKSLRKAFLRYPIKFTRISSRFTRARFHPVQKRWKAHKGTDFAAPIGTPIRAVGDGYITDSKYNKYNGNYIKIKHNETYSTQYLHMLRRAKGMTAGKRVKQGEIIGYVGKSGLATGPHLCFRFWKYGKQIDALRVKLPSEKSISKKFLNDFIEKMEMQKMKLDEISLYGNSRRIASL